MNIFLNDYNDIGHKAVLEKLQTIEKCGHYGYGYDIYTAQAKALIRKEVDDESVAVEFVSGGTMANIIALTSSLRGYEGIIAARTGHINAHEAGSIEATAHKIEGIDTEDGKLTAALLEKKIAELTEEHHIVPRVVYISQTTELGTVYQLQELERLYDVTTKAGLYLFIDGARMAAGLAASNVGIGDLPRVCDMFTLGGTKNGALFGEAVVVKEERLKAGLRHYMKQRGAVMAKGFLLGAQFEALFDNGLYYELGRRAHQAAMDLAKAIQNRVTFYMPPVSNQIFIRYPADKIDALKVNNLFEVMPLNETERVLRFVTTYRTKPEEIESLARDLQA
ncbi:beta-eliminating lyase-related protein [Peptoniphilus equinus]|uniref:Beta-eliminating lyase-related protein n=1 Tax=Peptoniphilus equinus TaxID=3016343 RepID=A0ABY7QT98_9FIRM|nr:beta-eliminating lyase-related protein [Peptoniphilus equinus]WBW49962.1 beta-eliminating lyase-related protein [Peptoniphilus equinus]